MISASREQIQNLDIKVDHTEGHMDLKTGGHREPSRLKSARLKTASRILGVTAKIL